MNCGGKTACTAYDHLSRDDDEKAQLVPFFCLLLFYYTLVAIHLVNGVSAGPISMPAYPISVNGWAVT